MSLLYVVNPWDHYVISSVNLNNVYNAQSLVENLMVALFLPHQMVSTEFITHRYHTLKF